jgi:hypothetical protein
VAVIGAALWVPRAWAATHAAVDTDNEMTLETVWNLFQVYANSLPLREHRMTFHEWLVAEHTSPHLDLHRLRKVTSMFDCGVTVSPPSYTMVG